MADVITIKYEDQVVFEANTDRMLDLQLLYGKAVFFESLKPGRFEVSVARDVKEQSLFRRLSVWLCSVFSHE